MDRPRTPVSTSIVVVLIIAWYAVAPLFVIFQGVLHDRWVLQETSRKWTYMGIVAAASFVPVAGAFLYLWNRWEPFPWRELAGFALWSIIGAWYGGELTLNVLNHSSSVPGQAVEFKIVDLLKGTVEIRAVGETYDGITFRYSTDLWRKLGAWETGTAPGIVYRGRLGLLWGEFKDK
jgi:hypothetical protein